MNDEGNITIITRSDTMQTEVYNNGKPTTYKVSWPNECTYILTPMQDVFDKYPDTPKGAKLIVRIFSYDKDTYIQSCKFNYAEEIFTSKVKKIK